jgi:hypothetical protein
MYVIVHSKSGQIFGFGLTPKKAMDHFLRGLLSYDGPRLDTRRCSPALYRQLQALEVVRGTSFRHTATPSRLIPAVDKEHPPAYMSGPSD